MMHHSVFFQPSFEFVTWLIDYAKGRQILDVGCGQGALLRALYKQGYKNIIGIDLYPEDAWENLQEQKIAVIEGDATHNSIVGRNNQLVVIARPCHGREFPRKVISRAYNQAEILYIGLGKNIETDFPEGVRFRVLEAPGLEDETQVWSLGANYQYTQQWCLVLKVHLNELHYISWWQYDKASEIFINSHGGRCPKTLNDHILMTIETASFFDLDHSLTSAYQDLIKFCTNHARGYGWLAPDMQFYACHYADHDEFAEKVLLQSVSELEKLGWCRITEMYDEENYTYNHLLNIAIGPFRRSDLKLDAAKRLAEQYVTKEKLIERFPEKAEILSNTRIIGYDGML